MEEVPFVANISQAITWHPGAFLLQPSLTDGYPESADIRKDDNVNNLITTHPLSKSITHQTTNHRSDLY